MAQILIRCVNTKTQKVKFLLPDIANNKQLMKSQDNVISDPQYDYKMQMFKNPKSVVNPNSNIQEFSSNGQSKEPAKEVQAVCCPSNECDSVKLNVREALDDIKLVVNDKLILGENTIKKHKGRKPGSKNKPKTQTENA